MPAPASTEHAHKNPHFLNAKPRQIAISSLKGGRRSVGRFHRLGGPALPWRLPGIPAITTPAKNSTLLVDHAVDIEGRILDTLRRLKPDRPLPRLPRALFTPTFAVSRTVGWTTHAVVGSPATTARRQPPMSIPPPLLRVTNRCCPTSSG